MSMDWLKLYSEARNDAKLRALPSDEFRVWFNLLCFAGEQEERGTIPAIPERLLAAEVANSDVALLTKTLESLESLRMILREKGGSITFTAWEKRQRTKPSDMPQAVAARVAKHRATRQTADQRPTQNADVTPCNAHVTPRNANVTPTDRDIEYISTTPVHNYSTQPAETAREEGEALQAGEMERRTERVPVTVPNAVPDGESIADETLPVDDDPFDPRGPQPVAPDSPVSWDWARLAEKVRGNQRVDALFLARTLAAADQEPARRHWRAALNQLICDGKPDYVAGFAAYHLRRWTSGQAAPPSPPPQPVRYYNDTPEAREYERQLRERGELQMPGESTLEFFTRKLRQRGVNVPDAESFGGAQ